MNCPNSNCGKSLPSPPTLNRDYFTSCSKCCKDIFFDSKKQICEILTNSISDYMLKIPNKRPNIFFSHSFNKEDNFVNIFFEYLLSCLCSDVYSVRYDITPEDKIQKAKEGIEKCDFVFIVMPRRYQSLNRIWKTSDWLQNEIGMAYAFKKGIIAIAEEGVKDEGLLKDITHIHEFNRNYLYFPIWIELKARNIEEVKRDLMNILIQFQYNKNK